MNGTVKLEGVSVDGDFSIEVVHPDGRKVTILIPDEPREEYKNYDPFNYDSPVGLNMVFGGHYI